MDRLDALKVFCSVVEAGGFSRAADRLGISTSSVTNQVLALEAHFRTKLLNRTTRSMSLTAEGQFCYAQAQQLLGRMTELEDSLLLSGQVAAGVLRVDMPSIICRKYIAPALPGFLAAYPEINLKITVSDRMIDMAEEGVDVLIRIGNLPDSGLIAKTLCTTQYLCCAAPTLLDQYGPIETPHDLVQLPCLGFLNPKTRMVRPWQFHKDDEHHTHVPQGALAIDHIESIIEAAQAGCGIIQQLSVSLAPLIRDGRLTNVLQDWASTGPKLSVLYQQKHHKAAKIQAFVDFVAEVFKDA